MSDEPRVSDETRRALVKRANDLAEIEELRRLDRKPNGHRAACVCRFCFESYLAEREGRPKPLDPDRWIDPEDR